MKAILSRMPRVLGQRALSRLARDKRGTSAIEFALIAPLMLGLYIGCVEISDGVAADRKVTLVAGALANLSAQVTTISTNDMTNIMNASTAIITPYNAGNLTTTLSCIKIDTAGNATVGWSATVGGTIHAKGSTIVVPEDLKIKDSHGNYIASSLLFSEVTYLYVPVTGYIPAWSHIAATGISLNDHMYMSPRMTAPVYNSDACS